MLVAERPVNRPKGAQEDDCYHEGSDTNTGPATVPGTASSIRDHNEPQDLETIARQVGLGDAAVSTSWAFRWLPYLWLIE